MKRPGLQVGAIKGPKSVVAPKRTRRAAGNEGFALEVVEEEVISPTHHVGASSTVSSVVSLNELHSQITTAHERASGLVSGMENLLYSIVMLDTDAKEKALERLSRTMSSVQEEVADPRIMKVIAEAEVRVAVELAKNKRE